LILILYFILINPYDDDNNGFPIYIVLRIHSQNVNMFNNLARELDELNEYFITENNIDYDWLEWLGMVRNDWESNNNPLDISNFHIC